MVLFKIFIAFGMLVSNAPEELDSDGWYTIPKAKVSEEGIGADERDASVWVVFAKKIGGEKFLVSFPCEPTYFYQGASENRLEVSCQSGKAKFSLQILDRTDEDPSAVLAQRVHSSPGVILVREENRQKEAPSAQFSEASYWKEGFWYHERVVLSSEHTYLLQTKSAEYSIEEHLQFMHSFRV